MFSIPYFFATLPFLRYTRPVKNTAWASGGMVDLPAGRQARWNGMYSVYAIKSSVNGSIYVGMSHDVQKRLAEHNAGKTKSTKAYAPYVLLYQEYVGARPIARKREKYLKSGAGKEYLKSLV